MNIYTYIIYVHTYNYVCEFYESTEINERSLRQNVCNWIKISQGRMHIHAISHILLLVLLKST